MERRRTIRAYVGLGTNIGDTSTTLRDAVRALALLPDTRVRAVSRLYATAPVGVRDQPEFRNAVVVLDVRGAADREEAATALLLDLKAIERSFGRVDRGHWGPRELDLDILMFGGRAIEIERPARGRSSDPSKATRPGSRYLVVPHPEARDRLFVLAPLADVAPRLIPPGWGERVETARRRRLVEEGPDAVRAIARWDWGLGDWLPAADVRD